MLHAAFEDAPAHGRIVANPCDVPKKSKPAYRRPEVVPLSREQEAALIDAARGDRCEGIVLLGLDSGARQGELFALTWDDVDFEAGIVHVSKSVKDSNGTLYVGTTKTKGRRVIDVARSTLVALRRHREALVDAGYNGPWSSPINREAINGDRTSTGASLRGCWTSAPSGPASRSSASRSTTSGIRWPRCCSPTACRFAVVSKRLGHSKVSTTLDFYAHVSPETKATLGTASSSVLRRTRRR